MKDYFSIMRGRPEFNGKTDLEIELRLAGKFGVKRLTGLSNHDHRVNAMRMLFPSRIENDWRAKLVYSFARARENERKELMFLGASNSTKTSTLADLLLTLWWQCPEATSIYITSPYEDSTETGLWARLVEQFQEAKDANPELPGELKITDCKIILAKNNPLAFIKLISIDQVGKLVGKKAKAFDVGMMIIAADELPEFRQNGGPLVRVMNNLISVPNMMLIGAGNFAAPSDALGVFCDPANAVIQGGETGRPIVGGYAGLKLAEHREWISNRGGLVVRFDGDDSPGLSDPTKFFFLPTAAYRDQLAKQSGGNKSADFYRFWHSFPLLLTEEKTVTSIQKVRQSGALEDGYEWTNSTITTGSHCDPSSGGDAAIVQPWRMGMVKVDGGEEIQIFEAWGPPAIIPIDVSTTASMTPDEQVVRFHRGLAERLGIPVKNCSFDGSMRSGIVQEYGRLWSSAVVPIDYFGGATERPMSTSKELDRHGNAIYAKWNDKVVYLITEMWIALASLFISGQIRGLSCAIDTTVKQLCARKWEWRGKMKKLETKKQYRDANSGKSPNEADALVGGFEMARRLGFRMHGSVMKNGGGVKLLAEMLDNRNMTRLKMQAGGNKELQIRSIHRIQAPLKSTKLHRYGS